MQPFLVRAGRVITDPGAGPGVIAQGAVLVAGGEIAAVGTFDALSAAHPDLPVTGDGSAVLMPGLINAHDHGRGLSPQSLGIMDDLLEPWILSLMQLPPLDPGTETRLTALRQLKSGITTTVNSYYHPACAPEPAEAVLEGYEAAGIRASLIFSAMDMPATTRLLEAAQAILPPELQQEVATFRAGRRAFDPAVFEATLRRLAAGRRGARVDVMTGVVSGHWSSDAQLRGVAALARELGLAQQMHLLESRWQARDNALHPEGSITRHLAAQGVLEPGVSCAHCVQMGPDDWQVMAEAGASVVHNPSSNLRLQSGIAPVPGMIAAGVNVALGLDSMGLDDRPDMFAEMRLAHRLHGRLSARDVLAMATVRGAQAIGQGGRLGRLAPGCRADMVLLRDAEIFAPGLAAPDQVFDRVLHYGGPELVQDVWVEGAQVLSEGRHPQLDEVELQDLLAESLPEEASPLAGFVARIRPYLHRVMG